MADLHVEHTLKGIKLGPKLGPFPVVVWLVIVAAGLYVAHRRMAATTAASTDTTGTDTTGTDTTASTDTTGTDTTSSDVPFGVSNDAPAQIDGAAGTGSSSGAVEVTDNLTWQKLAIDWLVQNGTTATVATTAIDKYLAGATLSQAEGHAVNLAVAAVGAPPEGAPPVHVLAAPTPTPAPPRPRHHAPRKPPVSHPAPKPTKHAPRPTRHPSPAPRRTHYTVRSGDTLAGIATRHHTTAAKLYNANKATIENAAKAHRHASSDLGHWLFAGTVLVIP